MLNVGKKYPEVRVVNDQIGTPTYTYDLARLLVNMAETEKYGYYHATNEGGYISWYDFCCEFYRQYPYLVSTILLLAFGTVAGHLFIEAISSTFFAMITAGVYILSSKSEASLQRV